MEEGVGWREIQRLANGLERIRRGWAISTLPLLAAASLSFSTGRRLRANTRHLDTIVDFARARYTPPSPFVSMARSARRLAVNADTFDETFGRIWEKFDFAKYLQITTRLGLTPKLHQTVNFAHSVTIGSVKIDKASSWYNLGLSWLVLGIFSNYWIVSIFPLDFTVYAQRTV